MSKSALDLFDNVVVLKQGSRFNFLFQVRTISTDAFLRGIAAGDLLGKAVFTWRKAKVRLVGRHHNQCTAWPSSQKSRNSIDRRLQTLLSTIQVCRNVAAAATTRVASYGCD